MTKPTASKHQKKGKVNRIYWVVVWKKEGELAEEKIYKRKLYAETIFLRKYPYYKPLVHFIKILVPITPLTRKGKK